MAMYVSRVAKQFWLPYLQSCGVHPRLAGAEVIPYLDSQSTLNSCLKSIRKTQTVMILHAVRVQVPVSGYSATRNIEAPGPLACLADTAAEHVAVPVYTIYLPAHIKCVEEYHPEGT